MTERRFKRLVSDWKDCKTCEIGCFAQNKVFGEGSIPAKYLFVGEAPGVEEDKVGLPFVGKSGVLLRKTVGSIGLQNYFITNTVACRPSDRLGGANRKPKGDEIEACLDRLRRTIQIVKPDIIIAVGKVAENSLRSNTHFLGICNIMIEAIWHPAYILRSGGIKSKKYSAWVDSITNILYNRRQDGL